MGSRRPPLLGGSANNYSSAPSPFSSAGVSRDCAGMSRQQQLSLHTTIGRLDSITQQHSAQTHRHDAETDGGASPRPLVRQSRIEDPASTTRSRLDAEGISAVYRALRGGGRFAT